jgi:hypothetical protein
MDNAKLKTVFFLLMTLILCSCFSKGRINRVANWDETIGVMTKRLYGKSSVGEFKYTYKNKEYISKNGTGINVPGSIPGEKYILKVNPQNPEEYIPIDWKPTFTDDEQIALTTGTITKVYKFMYFSEDTILASHGINFNYSVDDYEYERSQRLPPNFKKLYGNLQVDKEYKVKYLVKNPQRAILILDNE